MCAFVCALVLSWAQIRFTPIPAHKAFLLIIKYYEKRRRRRDREIDERREKKRHKTLRPSCETEKQMQNASLRKEIKIIYLFITRRATTTCSRVCECVSALYWPRRDFSSFGVCTVQSPHIYKFFVSPIQFICVFQNQLSHFLSEAYTRHTTHGTRPDQRHREKENSQVFFFLLAALCCYSK